MEFIDTHTHLSLEDYDSDREAVIQRAKDAGCRKVLIPSTNNKDLPGVIRLCEENPGWAYPMIGLHPEDVSNGNQDPLNPPVKEDLPNYQIILNEMHKQLSQHNFIAIGEVGLDFYFSREFYDEQLIAFEEQIKWSIEYKLPLMLHCRKGQAEMVKLLRKYESDLVGGVVHCFSGNEFEAKELLTFSKFSLGIGGISTFKNSKLAEVLATTVPLSRIVLETDSPFLAPTPLRGQRNEPSFIPHIIKKLAEAYNVSEEEICQATNANASRIFFSHN